MFLYGSSPYLVCLLPLFSRANRYRPVAPGEPQSFARASVRASGNSEVANMCAPVRANFACLPFLAVRTFNDSQNMYLFFTLSRDGSLQEVQVLGLGEGFVERR